MRTIIKLTGTNGSGKTTAVRTILTLFPRDNLGERIVRGKAIPEDYVIRPPNTAPVIVLGSYRNACGGCDSIQPYSRIVDKLVDYTARYPKHNILMEGVLCSGRGSVGEFFDTLERTSIIYALMDTPLEICVDRVNARRCERGELRPTDPVNMTKKFQYFRKANDKLGTRGFDVRDVDHRRPVQTLMGWFGLEMAKEPRPCAFKS